MAQSVLEANDLNPKAFIDFIDLETFNLIEDEYYTESDLAEITSNVFAYMEMDAHTEVKLVGIEVASYYDSLQDAGVIEQEISLEEFETIITEDFNLEPENYHPVSFDFELTDLYSGETRKVDVGLLVFKNNDSWKTLPIPVFEYIFDEIDFDIPDSSKQDEEQDDWDEEQEDLGWDGELEEGNKLSTVDAKEMFENNCASCHGGDLSGGAGPDLTQVGSEYRAEEIFDIITNGTGSMPAQKQVMDHDAKALAAWLADYYN